MKHVHIVGIGPRTGTTLMMELMAHCFDFDAYSDHESRLFVMPNIPAQVYCSKFPTEIDVSVRALQYNSDLWVICLVRDPRDVIVSRHGKMPDVFWTDFSSIRKSMQFFKRIRNHEQFLVVRYEDLVTDPDKVQRFLAKKLTFLNKLNDFSNFESIVEPTDGAILALGGVRKIDHSSIGNWRNELPRVKAQLQDYPDMNDILIELDYERDNSWVMLLENINAENGSSKDEKVADFGPKRFERSIRLFLYEFLYRIGYPIKKPVITSRRNYRDRKG